MGTGIVIAGMGVVSAIGNNAGEVLDALLKEQSGIGPMQYLPSRHRTHPVGEVKLSNERLKELVGVPPASPVSRTTLLGAYALRQALSDAGLTVSAGDRVAIVNGTTVGGMDITERCFADMAAGASPSDILNHHDCGSASCDMACICGIEAEVCTVSTACSSALNAVMAGAEMLMNNEADVVIAGGAEALSLFHFCGFRSLMILDTEQCRPFDATRTGINLGEGAAYVVLQRQEDCRTAPKAYIAGYANACDAFHQTASSEDGTGAVLAMRGALDMAGLAAGEIQYVNTHGTGTPNNDLSESNAIRTVFGTSLPHVSSTKAYTGHTTSASGAIELVISILAMQHGFIPANTGWQHPMDGGIVPATGHTACHIRHVMCNAFGFGGNDSSMILGSEAGEDSPGRRSDSWETVVAAQSIIDEEEQLKDCKAFIPPMESRRMGKLMKAATLTSLRALKAAEVDVPDAIVTATARGMAENSEKFLRSMTEHGEEMLSPTLFMQSTHNTIGSGIAIRLGCHGYNITYSQGKDSWAWALRDAERLIRTGKARTVLVGWHDESTPLLNDLCRRAGRPIPPMLYSKSIVLKRKED